MGIKEKVHKYLPDFGDTQKIMILNQEGIKLQKT
jgi:hypothetical protein